MRHGTPDNPMGLDGFEFVEFAASGPGSLEPVFEMLGFEQIARHRSKAVELWRQNDINFVVNHEPGSTARVLAEEHGSCVAGLAFRVRGAHRAYARALARGARSITPTALPSSRSRS